MEIPAGLALTPVAGPTLCRSARRIRGRLRPMSAADVPGVIRSCVQRGWTIHPISGGKNWGMGSFLPDCDDAVLLDLSGLKGIGPLDRDALAVRIEAGVTQRELYDWLDREAPHLAFNVTGAGAATSLMGNALERGIGYAGSRVGEIFGLEYVLADGSAHRPDPEWFSRTGSIPAGPQVEALFAQSNLAVVTAGWIRLRRRQEVEAAVIISGEYEPVFSTVRRAYETGALVQPVHMAGNNRAGRVSAGLLRQLWGREPTEQEVGRIFPLVRGHTAIAAVHGSRRLAEAAIAEIRAGAPRSVRVRAVTGPALERALRWTRRLGLRDRHTFIAALKPLLALTWGEPSDAGLATLDLPPGGGDPDTAAAGCLYFNAVSVAREQASNQVEECVRTAGLDYGVTRVFMSVTTLVHVFTAYYPDEAAAAMHTRVRAVAQRLRDAGFPPYRLGQSTMTDTAGDVARAFKRQCDPNGVLSPGHYLP